MYKGLPNMTNQDTHAMPVRSYLIINKTSSGFFQDCSEVYFGHSWKIVLKTGIIEKLLKVVNNIKIWL